MTENLQTFCCTIFVLLKTAYLNATRPSLFFFVCIIIAFHLSSTPLSIADHGTWCAPHPSVAGSARVWTQGDRLRRHSVTGFPATNLNVSLDNII